MTCARRATGCFLAVLARLRDARGVRLCVGAAVELVSVRIAKCLDMATRDVRTLALRIHRSTAEIRA